MIWSELDWPALDRLRDGFLRGGSASGPYWKSATDLASYDLTFGERIGWKWDHVLRELRLHAWRPASRSVFDWGCGSGIASRRVIEFFGSGNFDALTCWDHSPVACDFATDAASRAFPGVRIASATPGFFDGNESIGLLVISHVLNELAPADVASLRALLMRADEILWVEPGTHDVSRSLGAIRDELRADFRIVAPCTHQNRCPALAPGRERDWCHFFAPPPGEIFADPNWVRFGQRVGIDLRSLPYCFIALERNRVSPRAQTTCSDRLDDKASVSPDHDRTLSRVIGRPECFKPYVRLLNCDASGLAELELPKRADPALYKQLERTKSPLVYRWRRDGDKILGGEPAG